ncbi:MAG TPA: flagellar hook-associated protein FlgL [Candidimonas sp.]|nr:flagellar hook-associated protein FlgL [Candidimonas sp.]
MRISSTLFFQTGLNSINAQQSDLMHLYQQIGSGQRMVTPSDDPLAAAQAINISQAQSMNKRYGDNREVAMRNLGTEENALTSVTLLLQDVKTRLVEVGNGTLSDADRATLSSVLSSARSNLLGLANSTDGSGQYLFSGAKGGTAAFQDINGKIVYKGDAGQRLIQADQTRQIAGSDVGSDVFSRAASGTTDYLSRALTPPAHAGTGVMTKPSITDPTGANIGNRFEIMFTAANEYTVNVVDPLGNIVQTAANQPYSAGASASLGLPGGVQVNLSGAPAAGDRFIVEPANSVAFVAGKGTATGTASIGSPRLSNYSLAQDGNSFAITFTALNEYTVEVKDSLGVVVQTETNQSFTPGRENVLQLPRGMEVKISGNPAISDTFTIDQAAPSAQTDLNIFDTLDSIIKSLEVPLQGDNLATAAFQNTLASAMQRIDVNYNNVLTVRSSVGSRMNELESLNANGNLRALSYSSALSKMEDLDYYGATAQLQLRTSALEAAALAFKKIQATSLFNMKG